MYAIEKWKVEWMMGVQTLAEVKIQKGIFQRDLLSLLLLAIAMRPLTFVHRKCTGVTKSPEKIHRFMYMDAVKVFAKNEDKLVTLIQTIRIYTQYIVMEFVIKMWHADNEKCQKRMIGRNRITK